MGTLSFGSFPRSANHFCLELIATALPEINFVHNEHYIYSIDKQENFFSTIRTPLECVPSWITFTKDMRENRAEQILEWYCTYYQKCKDSNVLIVPFEQITSLPLDSLNHVCDHFGISRTGFDSIEFDFSTDFHWPIKDKSNYGIIVDEMKNAPSFNLAMSLFEELCIPVG
jgi:hypothetical protein